MKVTCIHDAKVLRLILIPETPLESLQLSSMAEKSSNSIRTALTCVDGEGASQFSLEVG